VVPLSVRERNQSRESMPLSRKVSVLHDQHSSPVHKTTVGEKRRKKQGVGWTVHRDPLSGGGIAQRGTRERGGYGVRKYPHGLVIWSKVV